MNREPLVAIRHAPFHIDHLVRRSTGAAARRRRAHRTHGARPPRPGGRPGGGGRRRFTARRAAVCAVRDGRVRAGCRGRRGCVGRFSRTPPDHRAHLHRPDASHDHRSRHVRGDRNRRAAAGRRGGGRHGRADDARRRQPCSYSSAGNGRPEHRTPRRRHLDRRHRPAPGRRAEPRTNRRRRRHRLRRRGRLRAPARRHPVDGQRGRRAGRRTWARARSSTSTDSR